LIAMMVCAAPLALGQAGEAAPASIHGAIAGRVFDAQTKQPLSGIGVTARTITGDESFAAVTDERGSYRLPDTPAAVYSFSLRSEGVDVPVTERMDVRIAMPFLLEGCFEIDRSARSARVQAVCDSGFVEQARVATIGPHRFLLPEDFQEQPPAESGEAPTAIAHDGIECLTHDHFPQVDAGIHPGDQVQTSRVYFRSDKYPDFYYVEMAASHATIDDFRALLPKPGPETERIIYYVESVDKKFNPLQTAEFNPEVIAAEECRRRGPPAWFTGEDPSIVLGATSPGAAAIPPGFQAVGITGFINSLGIFSTVGGGAAGGAAAGTAVSTALIVSGGAAAAAATGIVVATSGDEASPPK
jgi:hypothetical protein